LTWGEEASAMDFDLTEDQEMLREAARGFLSTACPTSLVREMAEDERGHPLELWQKMGQMGWMGMVIPEEYGGAGADFLDLIVLLEEMGRVCLPGPFFSTVVLGGLTVLEAGSAEQREEILPPLAEGELLLTLALTEPSATYAPQGIQTKATQTDEGFLIQGTKLFVPDAHVSDYLICAARTKETEKPEDGVTLFMVDRESPGVTCTLLKTIAGDKQCEVIFDDVKVPGTSVLGRLDEGWPILDKVLERAVVAQCAEMVGGARRVLEMTVEYAKERMAFGHPIGSFQAIQHYCADMLVDVDGCSLVTYKAAWRLGEGLPAAQEVAMAKSLISEKFKRAAALAIEIHGAIGFTEEHDLPLYFKRAKAWEINLGDAGFHLDRIAKTAGV
jgi:alkylation response protein AidB-like acyl-CoA dehydrogenase